MDLKEHQADFHPRYPPARRRVEVDFRKATQRPAASNCSANSERHEDLGAHKHSGLGAPTILHQRLHNGITSVTYTYLKSTLKGNMLHRIC